MADTKVIIQGVNATDAAFRAVDKNLTGMGRTVASAATAVKGLIVGFGAAFLMAQIKRAQEFADGIEEMAKQAGLSTGALQELQQVQAQSGGSVQSFNAGMTEFTRIIGDAANGSGQAVDALKRVGITVQDLQKLSMEQLYVKASDALSKYADAGSRASVAQDLFGKSAKNSVNAFSVAADEIDRLRAAAKAAGQVLDESTIKNAKKTKDEMTALARVIDIQLTQAFVQAGPLLVKMAEQLADLAKNANMASRWLGLTKATNDEQRLEDLLQRRAEIAKNLIQIQAGMNVPDSSRPKWIEKLTWDLKLADRLIDDLRIKMATAKPPPFTPAITGKIVPVKTKKDKDKERDQNDFWEYEQNLQKKLTALDLYLMSDAEKNDAAFAQRSETLQELYSLDLLSQQEFYDRSAALSDQHAQRRLDLERKVAEGIVSMQHNTWSLAAGLLQAFAGKSRAAAIAVLAIHKGLAIAQTISSTAAAVMGAYKDLGPIAGAAAAAKIALLGKIQVGLIAATGLAEAAQVGRGGADLGTPANPIATAPSAIGQPSLAPAPRPVIVYLNVPDNGVPLSRDWLLNTFLPSFNEAVGDGANVTLVPR